MNRPKIGRRYRGLGDSGPWGSAPSSPSRPSSSPSRWRCGRPRPTGLRAHHPTVEPALLARDTCAPRSSRLADARAAMKALARDKNRRRFHHNWEKAIAGLLRAAHGADRPAALYEAAKARYALYRWSADESDRDEALSSRPRRAGGRARRKGARRGHPPRGGGRRPAAPASAAAGRTLRRLRRRPEDEESTDPALERVVNALAEAEEPAPQAEPRRGPAQRLRGEGLVQPGLHPRGHLPVALGGVAEAGAPRRRLPPAPPRARPQAGPARGAAPSSTRWAASGWRGSGLPRTAPTRCAWSSTSPATTASRSSSSTTRRAWCSTSASRPRRRPAPPADRRSDAAPARMRPRGRPRSKPASPPGAAAAAEAGDAAAEVPAARSTQAPAAEAGAGTRASSCPPAPWRRMERPAEPGLGSPPATPPGPGTEPDAGDEARPSCPEATRWTERPDPPHRGRRRTWRTRSRRHRPDARPGEGRHAGHRPQARAAAPRGRLRGGAHPQGRPLPGRWRSAPRSPTPPTATCSSRCTPTPTHAGSGPASRPIS